MSTGLFSALIGVVFLGERLKGIEWLGIALLIISSTYLVTGKDAKKQKEITIDKEVLQ